jgi:hypothetical protein
VWRVSFLIRLLLLTSICRMLDILIIENSHFL